MDDLHLLEPPVGLEDPEARDRLVGRLAARRYHHEYDDAAAAEGAARRHLDSVGPRGRLLEVGGAAGPVGALWLVSDDEERAVVDVVLRDDSLGPAVRGLVADLARAEGAARLTVTVSAGDRTAEALVRDGGFELMATQMRHRLDVAEPPEPPEPEPALTLDPLDEVAFEAWSDGEVERYAAERAAAGEAPERARRIAAQQHADLLPEGLRTAHHHLLAAHVDGEQVGMVWIGTERPMAFVYALEIDPAHRRRGHGAATMRSAARWARSRGAHAIGLNVFGPNRAARALYDDLGYEVTEQFWGLAL